MDLIKKEMFVLPERYQAMFENFNKNFPVIEKATKNFNKTQSQFMDTMLTISQPTVLRSARQCLAEISVTKLALIQAYFGSEKNKIELEKKKRSLENIEDELDKKLVELEIQEIETNMKESFGYIEGAIRSLSTYTDQYLNIMSAFDGKDLTEEDFEKDEERYHIMTAFTQALCAARSHGGLVDEGNQIYFHQIGINGTTAQNEITKYLNYECSLLQKEIDPPHDLTLKWLDDMVIKFSGCSKKYAERQNKKLINKTTLHSLKE